MKIDKLSDQEVLNLTDEQVASIFSNYHHLSAKRLFEVMESNPDFKEKMTILLRMLTKIGKTGAPIQ
jgi:hypothetical protein